jgi:hypothetical protein
MKGIVLNICLLFLFTAFCTAQQITYSDVLNENSKDMYYHIIGKVNGNILILKAQSPKFAVSIYQDDMVLKDKINLDFIPPKTFNIDFIEYSDSFYLVYQYKQKGIVYCMAAKMDGNVKKIGEPILLDTTKVGATGDEKIYTVITSDDKQKIMVFKIQEKDERFNFVTLLYDKQLQLIHKTRKDIGYNNDDDIYSDFQLDNDGNLVVARSIRVHNGDDIHALDLIIKASMIDTFAIWDLPLDKMYIDEMKIKIDNVNKRYVLNSFYYAERRGNIEGIYSSIWDVRGDSLIATRFTPLADSIRNIAKESGSAKTSFNDFFIRKMLLKKDGGYILVAEDYTKQSSGYNSWNRNDYLYPSRYGNSYYSPYYGSYYSPYSPYNNYYNYNNYNNTTRHYYYNILVFSVSSTGVIEWSNLIHKEQSSDNSDNFLSFATINTGPMVHFLFNSPEKKDAVLIDNVITADGKLKRNPSLKSYDKGYDFMIRFAKKTGARQLVVPCSYRGQVCFAKIDF